MTNLQIRLWNQHLIQDRLAKETQALIQNFLIYISIMIKDQINFFFQKPENKPLWVLNKKVSKMSIYCEDFVPRVLTRAVLLGLVNDPFPTEFNKTFFYLSLHFPLLFLAFVHIPSYKNCPCHCCFLFLVFFFCYALVIALFRVQNEQYFLSFRYFANSFYEPLDEWNNNKIQETKKILTILC